MATAFLETRLECLPVMCQRLRRLLPSRAELVLHGPAILRTWGLSTMTAVDHSERAHAQVRVDLQSSGRGKLFTAAANRHMCRQALAEHLALGGRDVSDSAVAFDIARRPSSPAEAGGTKRSNHPGSAALRFQNMKRQAYKQLHAPTRSLTPQELSTIRDKAREEWRAIQQDPAKLAEWRMLNKAEAEQKRLPALTAGGPQVREFRGLWGRSRNPGHLLPPAELVAHGVGVRAPTAEATWRDPQDVVTAPGPEREWPREAVCAVMGCCAAKKNVCRRHGMSRAAVRQLDQLAGKLSAWVDSLDRSSIKECVNVVWLHDTNPSAQAAGSTTEPGAGHGDRDAIVLLVDVRWRPKMQYFLPCCLPGSDAQSTRFRRPAFPFVVSLSTGRSRLGGEGDVLRMETSDELCARLLTDSDAWDVIPLQWEFVGGAESLLLMRVLGAGPPFQHAARRRATTASGASCELPPEFSLGDPFQHGADQGRGGDGGLLEPWSDMFAWDDVAGSGSSSDGEGAHGPQEGAQADADEGGASGVEDEEAPEEAETDLAEAGVAEASVATASPAEAAAAARVGAMGYVSCPLAPWAEIPQPGRITTWPASRPEHQRSVACRCYQHPRCSVTKSRRAVGDDVLLQWLFSGELPPEGATAAQRAELRDAHMNKFHELCAATAAG